ncbi:MAG: hypothetical protein JWM40_2083 [Frankiales bacterium]|nr:hypothetical protein [Frankiales bacterium]
MRRAFLALLLLLLTACQGHGQQTPPLTSERTAYRLVDDKGVVTQQVTDLQGPYRARTLTSSNGVPLGGFLWDETGLYAVAADGSLTQSEYVGPGFPGPASHLDLALPVALRQGLVSTLGPGTVGARACTRWVSLEPLDGAPFGPATTDERTESCVDPHGVILSETWTSSGKLIRTRTFVSRGTYRSNPDSLYDGKRPTPLPTALSEVVVKPSSAAKLAALLGVPVPAGPPGLKLDRASAVLDVNTDRDGFSREAAVLTWTGPARLVVLRIERDLEPGGRTAKGEPVDLGVLGKGRLEPVLAGLKVTVESGRLRLIATADLPEGELLSWLRSLTLQV